MLQVEYRCKHNSNRFSPHRAGHAYRDIAERLGMTINQVGKTIQSRRVSPRLSSGRPPILSPAKIDELEAFVCSLPETRQMSYLELSKNFPNGMLERLQLVMHPAEEDIVDKGLDRSIS